MTTNSSRSAASDLATISYTGGSVTTPGTTYTYDRLGRQQTAVRSGMTTTYTYNNANQPLTEAHAGGTLAGFGVTTTYTSSLQRDTLALAGVSGGHSVAHGYDAAGRLQSVTGNGVSATYAYLANSALINTVTFKQGATPRLTITRGYDFLNRLHGITSVPTGANQPTIGFQYRYNAANQRTRASLSDGSYWEYAYDALGQVTAGRRHWQDGTPVSGQQFEYGFDDIGNRKTTGGRASAVSSYTNNLVNQITGRGVAGVVDVVGIANPTANVTVGIQGQTAVNASRQGEYFHHAQSVPNTTAAQYPTLETKSLYGATATKTGQVFVPAAGEGYLYDLDGNLSQDGRWTYTWDGENRLVKQESLASAPSGSKRRLECAYDHQGRRIWRKVTNLDSNTVIAETRYLHDGWNVVAELPANSTTPLRTYVWGTDLSGTLGGAGGVGGLLWVNDIVGSANHFYAYDGNGNVAALVKASDASVSARYESGPFGEPIRQTGTFADAQPFRFSTKWTDDESGLLYYGYRYYNPSTGRWLNRDPIEEQSGANVYAFLNNSAVVHWDYLGLTASNCDTTCGPAVTRATQGVLRDVETEFTRWDTVGKLTACNRLHGHDGPKRGNPWDFIGRLQLAQNAWDILELAYHTSEIHDRTGYISIQPFGEPERCKFTVAFAGRCYFASQVNYILWGRMHRLCDNTFGRLPEHRGEWSLDNALRYTKAWKMRRHGMPGSWPDETREHIEQAMGFTKYGFNPAVRPDETACDDCRIQPGLADERKYHWTWLPFKTRDFEPW